jgi:hypothetical protein
VEQIDFGQAFHLGVRVSDIGEAMSELSRSFGLQWATPERRRRTVWLPGSGMHDTDLLMSMSTADPLHIELLVGTPASLWGAQSGAGPHHLGFWVDNVAATTQSLVEAGWVLEAARVPPDEGYGDFAYVRSPTGVLIEAVSRLAEPSLREWWNGGRLPAAS